MATGELTRLSKQSFQSSLCCFFPFDLWKVGQLASMLRFRREAGGDGLRLFHEAFS